MITGISIAFFYFVLPCATGYNFKPAIQGLRRSTVDHSVAHDCDGIGCLLGDVNPVCANGITFQNECLAVCQNIGLIEQGSCENGNKNGGLFLGIATEQGVTLHGQSVIDKTPSLSLEAMTRYADEGFICVGASMLGAVPYDLDPVYNPPLNKKGFPKNEKPKKRLETEEVFRVSYDGYVYFSRLVRLNEEGSTTQQQQKVKTKDKKSGKATRRVRRAKVIGIDSRTPVENTSDNPYRKIGEIDYGGYGEGGCSGAVVGKNSVLTAAHCVYSRSQGSFYPLRWFAPARPKYGHLLQDGYKWEISDATLYDAWVNSGDIDYDVAIVRVHANNKGNIGDVVGTLNMTSYRCNFDANSTVNGYPGDKTGAEDGMQFKSGKCDAWNHTCDALRVYHKCDTFAGNSGSPIIDSNHDICGVHTHGGNNWNSGVAFDSEHLGKFKSWMQ